MNKKLLTVVVVIMICSCIWTMLSGCDKYKDDTPTEPTVYVLQYTDNTGRHEIEVKSGDSYHIESIPVKEGYVFLGLYDAENNGVQYVDASGNSLSPFVDNVNMTLYPVFAAKKFEFVLDYQGAAVTGSRNFVAEYGSKISELPTNLSIENKTFCGWYTQPDRKGTQIADQYGVIPDKSIVNEENFDLTNKNNFVKLYAGFKNQEYLVTFYLQDGKAPIEMMVEYDTPIGEVVLDERVDGKAVIEWSKKSNDTAKEMIFTGRIKGEMILYANEFAPVIDFDVKGGEEIIPLVAREGDVIKLPTPTKSGYNFVGWYDAGDNQYQSTAMPANSLKLFAKWQAIIFLDERGGSDVADISQAQGTKIDLPKVEKAGYMFAGWYTENGDKYESSSMPATSIKLQAKYYEVKTEKIVIISATDKYGDNYSQTSPSIDYASHEIDLTKYFDVGVREIKVRIQYKSQVPGASVSSPRYHYMSWYSEKSASDAYKVWTYADEHTDGNWETYNREQTITLTSNKLYVCRFASARYNVYFYWTDFWMEFDYPDTSKLC